MIARWENRSIRINVQSGTRILISLCLELQYKMDREIRGACRFCVLLDMKNKIIFDRPQEMDREGCVSYPCEGKWAKAFREGRTSLADDPRSGRRPIPDGFERICANV
jgi:hypothetical protein